MADYSALYEVGNLLIELLRKNMTPQPIHKAENIGLCEPNDAGDYQLTFYLYHVEENGEITRNGYISQGPDKQQLAPMSLKLYYLLTAHSKGSPLNRAQDEHRILGRAMQVLRDNPILSAENLSGGQGQNQPNIRVSMNRLTHDQMVKIWTFTNKPYKLSTAYVVEPVFIDSSKIRTVTRVVDVDMTIQTKEGKNG